jgi:hypothetical protein
LREREGELERELESESWSEQRRYLARFMSNLAQTETFTAHQNEKNERGTFPLRGPRTRKGYIDMGATVRHISVLFELIFLVVHGVLGGVAARRGHGRCVRRAPAPTPTPTPTPRLPLPNSRWRAKKVMMNLGRLSKH